MCPGRPKRRRSRRQGPRRRIVPTGGAVRPAARACPAPERDTPWSIESAASTRLTAGCLGGGSGRRSTRRCRSQTDCDADFRVVPLIRHSGASTVARQVACTQVLEVAARRAAAGAGDRVLAVLGRRQPRRLRRCDPDHTHDRSAVQAERPVCGANTKGTRGAQGTHAGRFALAPRMPPGLIGSAGTTRSPSCDASGGCGCAGSEEADRVA
jgi:hypothetical protein